MASASLKRPPSNLSSRILPTRSSRSPVGNTQRNSLFGPHFRHVDLSLFKTFAITERVGLQFRAESYNISNTPNFYLGNGQPGDQFGSSGFGTISQTDPNYTARQYQFALKALF